MTCDSCTARRTLGFRALPRRAVSHTVTDKSTVLFRVLCAKLVCEFNTIAQVGFQDGDTCLTTVCSDVAELKRRSFYETEPRLNGYTSQSRGQYKLRCL